MILILNYVLHFLTMISLLLPALAAQTISFDLPVSADRWMYPYNATPGDRVNGSVFGTYGSDFVDEFHGQVYFAFDLTEVGLPAGTPVDSIQCDSMVFTVDANGINPIPYDPTPDSLESFETPSLDSDDGRPVVLWSAGGRSGFTGCTFPEDGPFAVGSPSGTGVRCVFPQAFDQETADFVDVSNSVRDQIAAPPLAIGTIDGAIPGNPILPYDRLTFEIDLAQPAARELIFGVDEFCGKVAFVLASWQEPTGMTGGFHSFFMRENPDVVFGFADAATLTGSFEILAPCPNDIDGDSTVGFADLLAVLADWGCNACPSSDVDGDGTVAFSDVLSVIANWGDC